MENHAIFIFVYSANLCFWIKIYSLMKGLYLMLDPYKILEN